MGMLRFFVLLVVLLILSGPAQAQVVTRVQPGAWVRIHTSIGESTSGVLVALEPEGVQVRSKQDLLEFSLSEVVLLEMSIGRRRDMGTLIGGGIGLIGGVAIGALLAGFDTGGTGANMAVIGVPLVTVPAAALLGAMMAPRRYLEVRLPDRDGASRARAVP